MLFMQILLCASGGGRTQSWYKDQLHSENEKEEGEIWFPGGGWFPPTLPKMLVN